MNCVAIAMRCSLTVYDVFGNFPRTAVKIYLRWLTDLIFFEFYVNSLGRTLASWYISRQLDKQRKNSISPNIKDLIEFEKSNNELLKYNHRVARLIGIAITCYLVIGLGLAVLNNVFLIKMDKYNDSSLRGTTIEAGVWFTTLTVIFTLALVV